MKVYPKCGHVDVQTCSTNKCVLQQEAPWVCFHRYHDDYDNPKDKQFIENKFGLKLTDEPENCPRTHSCAVHEYLKAKATVCQCDIWVTGCICGIFLKNG